MMELPLIAVSQCKGRWVKEVVFDCEFRLPWDGRFFVFIPGGWKFNYERVPAWLTRWLPGLIWKYRVPLAVYHWLRADRLQWADGSRVTPYLSWEIEGNVARRRVSRGYARQLLGRMLKHEGAGWAARMVLPRIVK